MNTLDQKRRATRSISEQSMNKINKVSDISMNDSIQKDYNQQLQQNSYNPLPKDSFYHQYKGQYISKPNQNVNKSVAEILKMNAIIKEEEEQQLQKSRNFIQMSITKDYQIKDSPFTERNGNKRENSISNQSIRVPTNKQIQIIKRGDLKLMKYYNFEDFIEKKRLQKLQKSFQQNQQHNSSQQQQYPAQNNVYVQKAYIMNIPQLKNIKLKQVNVQQKRNEQNPEEYNKNVQHLYQKQNNIFAVKENSNTRQASMEYIYDRSFQEEKLKDQESSMIGQLQQLKQKLQTDPSKKIQFSPKQTTVSILRLKDDVFENDTYMSEEKNIDHNRSYISNKQNTKLNKQLILNDSPQPNKEERFMKEIKISVQQDQNSIKIEAELGRINSPLILNLEIEILKESPSEFEQLDFKEIYEIPETQNIKYIKGYNRQSEKEEIIEIFECSDASSHLYYFKNLILRQLLQHKQITPLPTISTFALFNQKSSNKIVIVTVFPILIPVESIIHFRFFAKKPFPEKQLLNMMRSSILKIKHLYENYRLSVGQITTDNLYLDCSDYQIKFFNLSSASIHILPSQNSSYWNSSSLMKDCQELGQCYFMLKNLITQQKIKELSDSSQIEIIQELEQNRGQYSSEIIIELLTIQKQFQEAETHRLDYDPFKKIDWIFEIEIKEYQLEVVDIDFKRLEIFMNARILKDNQTFSLYYDKTLQYLKALAYKPNKTAADKQEESQLCLESWKIYLQRQEYQQCEKLGDKYISNFEEEEELNDNKNQFITDMYSKQAGVKIKLGKQNDARNYLQKALKIYTSLNQRYSSSSVVVLIELSKLDLVYESANYYDNSAKYLLELYFFHLFSKDKNCWNQSILIQIYELLALLSIKLDILEIQPFFYQQIILSMKQQMKQNNQVKSNVLVDYYIKCSDSYLQYSNFSEAVNQLDQAFNYSENQDQNRIITLKKSQIVQEVRKISNNQNATNENLQRIEEFRQILENCLELDVPNYLLYAETFEQYYKLNTEINNQSDDQFLEDLIYASILFNGEIINEPQKSLKFLQKAIEQLNYSAKLSEQQKIEKMIEIYEKMGLISSEIDQDLHSIMWVLLCSFLRQNQQTKVQLDETNLKYLNQICMCASRLKFDFINLIIQKAIVFNLRDEEEQLKNLMNIIKINIENENLQESIEFNQIAQKIAFKLKDQKSIDDLKIYKSFLYFKIPDSDEAKQSVVSLRTKIQKCIEESSFNEAAQLYNQYFKIIEAQKQQNLSIETVEEYNEYADIIWKTEDKKKAMLYFKKGLKLQIKLFTMNDPNTLKNMFNMGVLYYELEMLEEALILFKDILKIHRRNKTYNIQYFQSLENEANIYKLQKNIDQSLITLNEYHDMIQKFPPKSNSYQFKFYEITFEIGRLYSEQRKYYEAENYYKQALQIKTKLQSNEVNIKIQKYLYEYSQCLFQVNNTIEAQCVFKEQIDTWRRLKTIKPTQMKIYLDDYQQLFVQYSDLRNMYDIVQEVKQYFETKNNKTNIQNNEFYKLICSKLNEIESQYKYK